MIATPGPACTPLPAGADECVTPDGEPRPAYARALGAALMDASRLAGLRERACAWFADRGITFGVPDPEGRPIFPFDPIPRVLAAAEWRSLERALAQRVMALDAFVADCYGAQRALATG